MLLNLAPLLLLPTVLIRLKFEHGTITYLLSSTVTRPVTIAPTSTLHRKLNVQEIIDIAPIPKPKPQLLSLEASHRRKTPRLGTRKREKTSLDSANSVSSPTSISPQIEEDPPRSPVPSEISSVSATGSSVSSTQFGLRTPALSTFSGVTPDAYAIGSQDTAYAKTELLQGGCLAGDSLPIRIEIHHNKQVKSMHGVIITLFRLGRIDTHPAIPLGHVRKGEKPKFEDYYPRSRTGLGGLSLSAAGSSKSFRQDLNQVFAPIIVQGTSLEQVINTSIPIPYDLFPTISGVPGAMISFNYYVEIVVDLRGKAVNQDRILDQLSITSLPQHGYGDPRISKFEGVDGISYHSTPGFNYLITDQLRRTKGVLFTKTKIVIGTRDSGRKRRKQKEERFVSKNYPPMEGSVELGRELEPQDANDSEQEQRVGQMQNDQHHGIDVRDHNQTVWIPPPDIDQDVDEKTRLKRAEERLLPSSPPPADDGEEPSSLAGLVPSAPPAIDEEDFIQRYALSAPAYDGRSRQQPETSNAGLPSHSPTQQVVDPQNDKQELERQRLLALASSPDAGDEADDAEPGPPAFEPSAPVLYEDDIFDINDPRIPQSSPDIEQSPPINEDDPHRGNNDFDEGVSSHSHESAYNEDLPLYKQ